jgi:hypothetical protein
VYRVLNEKYITIMVAYGRMLKILNKQATRSDPPASVLDRMEVNNHSSKKVARHEMSGRASDFNGSFAQIKRSRTHTYSVITSQVIMFPKERRVA